MQRCGEGVGPLPGAAAPVPCCAGRRCKPGPALPHVQMRMRCRRLPCPQLHPSFQAVPLGSSSATTAASRAASPAWPAARPARPTNWYGLAACKIGRVPPPQSPAGLPPSPRQPTGTLVCPPQVSGHRVSTTVELCSSFIERSGELAPGTGCPSSVKLNENFDAFDFKQANTSPPPEQDALCGEAAFAPGAAQPPAEPTKGQPAAMCRCADRSQHACCAPGRCRTPLQAWPTRASRCCPRRPTTAHTPAACTAWRP